MSSPFGFPDWQNQRPLDGPPLLVDANVVRTGFFQFPLMFVGRWARLGGQMQVATNPVRVTMHWLTSNVNGDIVGSRQFVLDPNPIWHANIMIPNMGPWLMVQVQSNNPAPYTLGTTLFGTNRQQPIEFIPPGPTLLTYANQPIAAGATKTDWLLGYYAGPARLWVTGGAAWTINVDCEVDIATLNLFYQNALAAAGGVRDSMVIPPGACRVRLVNDGAAAANFYLSLVPSFTGG